jgi:hypothetical protein
MGIVITMPFQYGTVILILQTKMPCKNYHTTFNDQQFPTFDSYFYQCIKNE